MYGTRYRAKPTTTGVWERVARKHYRHVAGFEVRHDGSAWAIVGGPECGYRYGTLSVAQHSATRHLGRKS